MSDVSNALVVTTAAVVEPPQPKPSSLLPALPWRDPHSVPALELQAHILRLEQACLEHPHSADLRTCLGMAYAMNYDVYKSMDALEAATTINPSHFWAQLKYGELHYRLRTLRRAEAETVKAVELAETPLQLSVARKQLQEIRKLTHDAARNVEWNKPLTKPALVLSAMLLATFVLMMWK